MNKNQTGKLDQLNPLTHGRRVEVFEPTNTEVKEFSEEFIKDVGGAASVQTVLNIFQHNSEAIIAFKSKKECGFVALLPLNRSGMIALADGRFQTNSPQIEYICQADEKPHCLYVWAISITPQLAGGIAHVYDLIKRRYGHLTTLYCRAANERAERLFLNLGFVRGAKIAGTFLPDVMSYQRQDMGELSDGSTRHRPVTNRPIYDSYDPETTRKGRIGIKVVHTMEELKQVLIIRAASYLAEQDMPYAEDADGNDYCAAHLVGYVGSEPAGCMRIRFFKDFAKLERLAVIKRFRGTSLALRLVRASVEYCRMKGYERFYGQTELDVFPIWERVGFVLRPGDGIAYMTDRRYFEGDMIVDPHLDPITPASGGDIIIRPEGQWHRKSAMETYSDEQ